MSLPHSSGGEIDTSGIMTIVNKIQAEVASKVDSKTILEFQTILNNKADKVEMGKEFDRVDKTIGDIKRSFITLEDKIKQMDREIK